MVKRLLTILASVLCLSFSLLTGAPAQGDDIISTQPYVSTLGLSNLRAQGLTGKGITIAMIDGPVDTSVPELAGANIINKKICDFTPTPTQVAHGTTVASILVSQNYGWAPDATLINYVYPVSREDRESSACKGRANHEFSINSALNDGVDIINISQGDDITNGYSLARAAKMGVPVVVSAGNEKTKDLVVSLSTANITIGVSATDSSGKLASFSNYGKGVTVSAPGTDITARAPDATGTLTKITSGKIGTSFSAPIVAGTIALAMEKWPYATGNQIIRSLINTADRDKNGWEEQLGWGPVNPEGMIAEDPTSLEDTNPLLDKFDQDPNIHPNSQEIADYNDGLVDPGNHSLGVDHSYVYRGLNETIMISYPAITQLGTSPRYDK